LKLRLHVQQAERICTTIERWLITLVPIALVTLSGVADVFCSVVAILFVVRSAIRRDGASFNRHWFIALLVLWIYLCIRSVFAIHPVASLSEAFVWLRYPVFAIAASETLRHDDDRRRFVTITMWSVLFLSVDAIAQYFVGYDIAARPEQDDMRLTGPFGRPRVGITIAWMFLPPLLALVQCRRWLWAAALGGASILAITLSGERMSLATLGLDVIGLLILLPHWRRQILIVVGLCAALLLVVMIARPSLYQRQVNSTWHVVTALDQSPYGVLWSSGLAIASEHPIFGVGMRNYRIVCPDPALGPLLGIHDYPRCSTHPHNYYLEWAIAGGIPALVFFVTAMGLLLRDLLVYGDTRNLLFTGLVATILMRLWPVASTTSFFHNWSAIPLFLTIGWALSYLPEQRSAREQAFAPAVQSARQ
jgi:O-antigen ligase